MNKLFLTLFILSSYTLLAQKPGKQDDGLITGKIIDENSSKPLEYVSFRLFKQNESKVIAGIFTDNTGKINLENVPQGSFYAICSFTGYVNDTILDIRISANLKVYNL